MQQFFLTIQLIYKEVQYMFNQKINLYNYKIVYYKIISSYQATVVQFILIIITKMFHFIILVL